MTNRFSAISPHIYAPFNPRAYRKNMGDGIILRAIERRLGRFEDRNLFPKSSAPTAVQSAAMRESRGVVLAGANQLQDNFSPWPGLTAQQLRESGLLIFPFGVGLPGKGDGEGVDFTDEAVEVLRAIHERIEYSSWRCPRTVKALEEALPELKGRFLMTCCPVVLDTPLLEGNEFPDRDKTVAVSITDRGDFWERELPILERIAKRYPKSRRVLVLHGNYTLPVISDFQIERTGLPRSVIGDVLAIRQVARKLGFEVFRPKTGDACAAFYRDEADIHFGSRLHAHLFMLSHNKKSFLIFVDERMSGFSDYLGFPMCDPNKIDGYLDFDFEIVRRKAQEAEVVMQRFVTSMESA